MSDVDTARLRDLARRNMVIANAPVIALCDEVDALRAKADSHDGDWMRVADELGVVHEQSHGPSHPGDVSDVIGAIRILKEAADSADERVRAAHIAGMREAMDIVDNGDHTSEEGCALWERIVELEAEANGGRPATIAPRESRRAHVAGLREGLSIALAESAFDSERSEYRVDIDALDDAVEQRIKAIESAGELAATTDK